MCPLYSGKRKSPIPAIAGFLLTIALLLTTATPGTALAAKHPDTMNVAVTGTGAIVKANVPKARSAAIASGLSAAVERVITELLPTDAMVIYFDELNKLLHVPQPGFIQGYKVLAETEHGKQYRVMVQATVDVGKVKEALTAKEIIGIPVAMPSVLLLISEERIGDTVPRYWWNTAPSAPSDTVTDKTMAGLLAGSGFTVVPRTLSQSADADAGPAPDNRAALAMGARHNADIVIVGTALAARGRNSMGTELSFSGKVSARALATATGTELVATTKNALTTDSDEKAGGLSAIVSAGKDAGIELAAKVAEAWKKAGPAKDRVRIEVRGENCLIKLVKFRRVLIDLPGVSELQTLEMESNRALLSIAYDGISEELVDELMHQDFGTFGIGISEVLAERLEIDFTSQE